MKLSRVCASLIFCCLIPSVGLATESENVIKIQAVGDLVLGTNFPYNKLLPTGEEKQLFAGVQSALGQGDIVFGNFESTLTTQENSPKFPKMTEGENNKKGSGLVFAFRTPPSYISLLKEVGFNTLNIANNHSRDFGIAGFKDTIQVIKNAGITAFGEKDEIVYKKVKNIPLAFIGFSYLKHHNTVQDIPRAIQLVREAKKNAKLVIVSMHVGAEGAQAQHTPNQDEIFHQENRGNSIKFAHAVVDAGADLVLGHGPHVLRAMELYKDRLIAYSLGNFVGYRTLSTAGDRAYSAILEVSLSPQGQLLDKRIVGVKLSGTGIPQLDSQNYAKELVKKLSDEDFPETKAFK